MKFRYEEAPSDIKSLQEDMRLEELCSTIVHVLVGSYDVNIVFINDLKKDLKSFLEADMSNEFDNTYDDALDAIERKLEFFKKNPAVIAR